MIGLNLGIGAFRLEALRPRFNSLNQLCGQWFAAAGVLRHCHLQARGGWSNEHRFLENSCHFNHRRRSVRSAGHDDLLRSLGYLTAAFASAEDFLQSRKIRETTCLISDVQMPGLSGVDLQRLLIAEGNRMPMIFITAYFDERIRQSVMEAGAIGYLSKPFDEQSLIGLLQSVHRRDDLQPRPKSCIRSFAGVSPLTVDWARSAS